MAAPPSPVGSTGALGGGGGPPSTRPLPGARLLGPTGPPSPALPGPPPPAPTDWISAATSSLAARLRPRNVALPLGVGKGLPAAPLWAGPPAAAGSTGESCPHTQRTGGAGGSGGEGTRESEGFAAEPGLGGMPGSSSQVLAQGGPCQTGGRIVSVHALNFPHPSPQPMFRDQVPAPSASPGLSDLTHSALPPLVHAAHASLVHATHVSPPPAGRPTPHAPLAGPRAPFPPAPTTGRGAPLVSQSHASPAHATHALLPPDPAGRGRPPRVTFPLGPTTGCGAPRVSQSHALPVYATHAPLPPDPAGRGRPPRATFPLGPTMGCSAPLASPSHVPPPPDPLGRGRPPASFPFAPVGRNVPPAPHSHGGSSHAPYASPTSALMHRGGPQVSMPPPLSSPVPPNNRRAAPEGMFWDEDHVPSIDAPLLQVQPREQPCVFGCGGTLVKHVGSWAFRWTCTRCRRHTVDAAPRWPLARSWAAHAPIELVTQICTIRAGCWSEGATTPQPGTTQSHVSIFILHHLFYVLPLSLALALRDFLVASHGVVSESFVSTALFTWCTAHTEAAQRGGALEGEGPSWLSTGMWEVSLGRSGAGVDGVLCMGPDGAYFHPWGHPFPRVRHAGEGGGASRGRGGVP